MLQASQSPSRKEHPAKTVLISFISPEACSLLTAPTFHHLSRNRNLDLHTGLNIDNNLLHHFGRRIQINQPLVDPHLKHIPRLAALTAGCLPGRDFEGLGRQADRALNAQVLGLGALEELGADFFEGGDFTTGEGYANFVDFLLQG
jgi:hypothetical protein